MPHLQHELEKWDHSHEKHPTLWEMCGLMGCCTLVWKCLENHDILPVMQNLCGFSDRRVGYAQAGRNINLLPCDIPNEWTIISKTATFQESVEIENQTYQGGICFFLLRRFCSLLTRQCP